MSKYKIFCDESNHLENDSSNLMVLGAIQCVEEEVTKANKTIKYLRHKHNYHVTSFYIDRIGKKEATQRKYNEYIAKSDVRLNGREWF